MEGRLRRIIYKRQSGFCKVTNAQDHIITTKRLWEKTIKEGKSIFSFLRFGESLRQDPLGEGMGNLNSKRNKHQINQRIQNIYRSKFLL